MWPELDPTTAIVGIGDFNGDGITDLLLKSADGTYTDWLGQTDGSFTDNSTNFDLNPGSDWHVVATGNFNGDGFDDVLWRSDSGTADDLLGATNGSFVGNPNFVLNPGADWHIVGTGDFNGDGFSDILWQSDSGTLNEFLGQSNGGFIGNVLATNPGSAWHVAGTGDFNGDGKDDILWRNDSGVISDWLGQADGTFVDNYANAANGSASTSWQVAGTGDFNGDGRTDILWRNTDGTIDDFLGQANGGFIDNYAVAMQPLNNELQIAGVGNFDGDGRADVLIRASDGSVQTWVGSANGAILSPMEKLWQDEVSTVAQFFDEITKALDASDPTSTGGGDQNSYYADEEDRASPINAGLEDLWGWHPTVQANPNVSLLQLLNGTIDEDFKLLGLSQIDFSAAFDGTFGSMSVADPLANTFTFDIHGFEVTGTSESGAPPAPQSSPQAPIYITAPLASGGFFVFDPIANEINFGDGYGGRGGITFYETPGASAEANLFSSLHVHNQGTTPADEHTYDLARDALAKFYDWAIKNPESLVDLGDGTNIMAQYALLKLSQVTIDVVDTSVSQGAATQPSADFSSATIWLNPQNAGTNNFVNWISSYGDTGINFTIFHELGHAIYDVFEHAEDTEAMADSAAFSLMGLLRIPTPPETAVTGGFDD